MQHVYLVTVQSPDDRLDKNMIAAGVHVALDDFENAIPVGVDRLEPTEDHVRALLPPEDR